MAQFIWTNDLNTGNPFIDEDHQKLVAMINTFHSLLDQNRADAATGKVLSNLVTYYRVHFEREEMEMLRIDYADYLYHRLEHEKFIREVDMLKRNFDQGKKINPDYVARMLRDWLIDHIEKVDQKLAATLKVDPDS